MFVSTDVDALTIKNTNNQTFVLLKMCLFLGQNVIPTVEVGSCGLNCQKPKPNSTRNIIPSAANFDIYIYIYILGLRLCCSRVCVENS